MLGALQALDFSAALSGLGRLLSPNETADVLWDELGYLKQRIVAIALTTAGIDTGGMSTEAYFKTQVGNLLPESGYRLSQGDATGAVSVDEMLSRVPAKTREKIQPFVGQISSLLEGLAQKDYYIVKIGGSATPVTALPTRTAPSPLPSAAIATGATTAVRRESNDVSSPAFSVPSLQFSIPAHGFPSATAQWRARQDAQNQAQWRARLPWIIVGVGGLIAVISIALLMGGSSKTTTAPAGPA